MAGQRGRDVLVRIGDGLAPESFSALVGIQASKILLGAVPVDATTVDSVLGWRELMVGAGTRRVDVSGDGVFKDALSDAVMRGAFFGRKPLSLELAVPDFGVMRGAFEVLELVYSGAYDGEAAFSVRLGSAGVVVFEG